MFLVISAFVALVMSVSIGARMINHEGICVLHMAIWAASVLATVMQIL